MEFDERLQRTFESLAAHLHQEIAGQLTATGAELSASVQADRDAARAERDAAVAEAAREARTATERELAARLADEVARAETQARAELAATHRAASDRLIEAIRSIDGAHSLSEILDALVASASSEVGRAAMFLLQGSTLKGWRLVGFDEFGAVGSRIELPVADGGLIAEAVEAGRSVRVDPGSPRSGVLPAFVDLAERSKALAVPLVMSGQVFAVLYVDEGNNEPMGKESWPATIEVLARHAARALEAITATRLAQI